MGRAERRMKERRKRIEERKDKILLSREDIMKMKMDVSDAVSDFSTEALLTCFAITMRRKDGYGPKRIFDRLQYVDELFGKILDGSKTIEDYKRELEDETGVKIKCDEE